MKTLSETTALKKLSALKNDFRRRIFENYEHRAKSCETCETQGACCLDAHFVNVRITKLEAAAINLQLQNLSAELLAELNRRIAETIEKYDLDGEGDSFAKTYACPLFEKGVGCLVHPVKPAACIQHACYERREDLPPDEMQIEVELKIERLNEQTYKKKTNWLPIPISLRNAHFPVRRSD